MIALISLTLFLGGCFAAFYFLTKTNQTDLAEYDQNWYDDMNG